MKLEKGATFPQSVLCGILRLGAAMAKSVLISSLLLLACIALPSAAHGTHSHRDVERHAQDHDHHHAHDHDHEHGHDHHEHDIHDHEHSLIDVSAKSWEKLVQDDAHVWVVKFYSKMCGSCQAFAPAFEKAVESVEGLHWAQVNIDDKENVSLAKKMGILNEGIPNVKIFNMAEAPLPVVTGDTPTEDALIKSIKDALSSSSGRKDAHGFYTGTRHGTEL